MKKNIPVCFRIERVYTKCKQYVICSLWKFLNITSLFSLHDIMSYNSRNDEFLLWIFWVSKPTNIFVRDGIQLMFLFSSKCWILSVLFWHEHMFVYIYHNHFSAWYKLWISRKINNSKTDTLSKSLITYSGFYYHVCEKLIKSFFVKVFVMNIRDVN